MEKERRKKREEDEIFHYLVGVKREMKENRVGGIWKKMRRGY